MSRPGVVISSSLIRTLYIPQTHSIARSFLWAGAIGQREKTETADGRRNRNKFEPTKTHFASPVRLDTYKIQSHTAEDGPCLCPTYLIGKPRQHERTNERTGGKALLHSLCGLERFNLGDEFNKRVEGERDYCQVRGWENKSRIANQHFFFSISGKINSETSRDRKMRSLGPTTHVPSSKKWWLKQLTCIEFTSSRS